MKRTYHNHDIEDYIDYHDIEDYIDYHDIRCILHITTVVASANV